MRTHKTYKKFGVPPGALAPMLLLALAAIFMSAGCQSGNFRRMNKRVTLWRKDKIPYGTFFAYENLKFIFPDSRITVNQVSPSSYGFDASPDEGYKSMVLGERHKKAYIIIAPSMTPEQTEWNAIMDFVGKGNHVFISSMYFSDSLLSSLKLTLKSDYSVFDNRDSLQVSVNNPVTNDSLFFQYPGNGSGSYTTTIDSQYTTILGRDGKGRPNFVRYTYKGGGSLCLHFAPLALSNFFLLHKDNHAYYENVMSYLPSSVKEVKWDEYFRYHRRTNFSALQYILGIRSLRWTLWLVLLLFLLIYLFESKRRQRLVPVIPPLHNSSLDFVKTIGRLYYQRKDNQNLALKMVAHFLDHIRVRYQLQTSVLDAGFAGRLSYKSGVAKEELEEIMVSVRDIQIGIEVTDEYLLDFNRKMEDFYRQA